MTTITVTFDPPVPSDTPSTFNSKAFATLGALNTWSSQANTVASEVSTNATTASNAASTATTQAGIATSAASTATTQAGNASTSASNASASASAASTSATSASNSAAAAAASAASVNLSSIAITGGTINGASIGATTRSTGAFTTVTATGNGDFNTGANGRLKTGSSTYSGYFEANGGGSGAVITITPNTISGANGVDYNTSFVSGGNGPHNFKIGGTTYATVSSTGLAVTGALSATNLTTISQDAAAQNRYLRLTDTNGTGGRSWDLVLRNGGTAGLFSIYDHTASASRLDLDSSGNLGLGVAPNTAGWSGLANKVFEGSGYAFAPLGTNSVAFAQNAVGNGSGGWKYSASFPASYYLQQNGTHNWFTAASGTAGNTITWTQAMKVDGSSALHLQISTNRASGAFAQIDYGASGAVISYFGAASQLVTGGVVSDFALRAEGNLVFASNGSNERGRFDTSGNFLVGTTSNGGNYKVVLSFAGASTNGLVLTNTSSTGAPTNLSLAEASQSLNNTDACAVYTDATTVRWNLRKNGGLANYSANNVNLSDARLKTDFQPAKSYFERWTDIDFITYLYKDQTDTERNLGVTAQQLESVFPELIDNSGFGKAPDGEAPYKAVYQTDFSYAAAKALQEAIAKIKQLEADKAALMPVLASVDDRLYALEAR